MRDIDQIIQLVKRADPAVDFQQLTIKHPADDDGLWFVTRPECEFEVQIESSTGMCPFMIETDESDTRITATSVSEAVMGLTKLLHLHTDKSR